MSLIVKYSESKAIPEGKYTAKLTNLTPQDHPKWGSGIKWTFEIVEPAKYAGIDVTAMSSVKVSPKSKIFSWMSSFGVKLVPGEEVDLEGLIGKMVRVMVKNNTQSRNIDGRAQEITFSNVTALAPYVPPQTSSSQSSSPQPDSIKSSVAEEADNFADGDDEFNF